MRLDALDMAGYRTVRTQNMLVTSLSLTKKVLSENIANSSRFSRGSKWKTLLKLNISNKDVLLEYRRSGSWPRVCDRPGFT